MFSDISERDYNWPGVVYHVSSDPIDKFELLQMIDRAYESEITVIPSENVKIDRSLDSSRFRSITGFSPKAWPEMVDRMRGDATVYKRF